MFAITENKGVHITFDNGYTVSAQWGADNYCSRYGRHLEEGYQYREEMRMDLVESQDCEIAIWRNVRKSWETDKILSELGIDKYRPGPCSVAADVTAEEFAKILMYMATRPNQ